MHEENINSHTFQNAEYVEAQAICLERWGAVPSPDMEDEYHISPPHEVVTDLSMAVSQLYEDAAFQTLSDDEKRATLQNLAWLINDKWMGWRTSSYRDMIINAVQGTKVATELDDKHIIWIGDEVFVDSYFLEGYPFPADMFRVRNHLHSGEMVILLSKTGVVGVAHATQEEQLLTIIDLPVKDDDLQQRYDALARSMRELADLESQEKAFNRLLRQFHETGSFTPIENEQGDEPLDVLGRLDDLVVSFDNLLQQLELVGEMSGHKAAVEHKQQELFEAYMSYSEDVRFALFKLVERHQSHVDRVADANSILPDRAIRALVSLIRKYQGNLDRMRMEKAAAAADLLVPAQLLRQISLRVGPFPHYVLVKVSEALGTIHLQMAYDCFHKAGIEGFEQPVKFVVLETRESTKLRMQFDSGQSLLQSQRFPQELLDALLLASDSPEKAAEFLKLAELAESDSLSPVSLMTALERVKTGLERAVLILLFLLLGSEGIQSLIEATGHDSESVRYTALVALNQAGTDALPQLLDALQTHDPQQRLRLCVVLASMGEIALDPLLSTLQADDAYQRAGAMMALPILDRHYDCVPWNAVSRSTIWKAVNTLSHPEESVHTAALMFLTSLGSKVGLAVEPLIDLATSRSEDVSSRALAAFMMMGDEVVHRKLSHLAIVLSCPATEVAGYGCKADLRRLIASPRRGTLQP